MRSMISAADVLKTLWFLFWAALTVPIILTAQYWSVEGPEWLTSAQDGYKGNGVLVICAAVACALCIVLAVLPLTPAFEKEK